ncbi:MAG TPA: diacylglycerol kinase family protein [Anaerolineales bacterium]|nr:diacylglycerol kinase family protein [Anaerolineales bacterium]
MQIDIQQRLKTYVVLNPVAGVSEPGTVRERIETALQAHGFPLEIYETTGGQDEDIRRLVREAVKQGFQLFISAGGDGTLSSVIDGLVGSEIPLVIIPTGTWNALARALDIPLQVDEAIDLMFQPHRIQTIDAMQVGEDYFVLSVSAGIGAMTMKDVERKDKRRLGKLADLRKAVAEMLEFRSFQFEVKIDGELTTKFRAAELMVANTSILGLKALRLDSNIRMDDGKLNVCRIYANTVTDYLKLGLSMLRPNEERSWNVFCMEALQEVEISSRERIPVQGDGELIGQLPVTVKLRPKAIRVLTPPNAQAV